MSCGAACARQLLLDVNINVPEANIIAHTGFSSGSPIWGPPLAEALSHFHSGVIYDAGSVSPMNFNAVLATGAFLALLKTTQGKHWVIVDNYAPTHAVVHVRDPAGTPANKNLGAEAVMDLEKFHELWRRAFNYAVYRRP